MLYIHGCTINSEYCYIALLHCLCRFLSHPPQNTVGTLLLCRHSQIHVPNRPFPPEQQQEVWWHRITKQFLLLLSLSLLKIHNNFFNIEYSYYYSYCIAVNFSIFRSRSTLSGRKKKTNAVSSLWQLRALISLLNFKRSVWNQNVWLGQKWSRAGFYHANSGWLWGPFLIIPGTYVKAGYQRPTQTHSTGILCLHGCLALCFFDQTPSQKQTHPAH